MCVSSFFFPVSVGFLNPALYQIYAQDPTIFNDITSGENNCPAAQSNPVRYYIHTTHSLQQHIHMMITSEYSTLYFMYMMIST